MVNFGPVASGFMCDGQREMKSPSRPKRVAREPVADVERAIAADTHDV